MTAPAKQMRFRERPELTPQWKCVQHGSPHVALRVTRTGVDDIAELITYACGCRSVRIVGRVKPQSHFDAIELRIQRANATQAPSHHIGDAVARREA